MDHTHVCPACGVANPLSLQRCQECKPLFYPEPQPWENLNLQELPLRAQLEQAVLSQQQLLTQPQVKPVGTTTRRKFLVGLLGSAAILGLGSPALAQLFQNVEVAFTTRDFPSDIYQNLLSISFSHDLNLMAMSSVKDDGLLYLWDYQQQRMTTLPAHPFIGWIAWSPNNNYLLCQTKSADKAKELDIWDVKARKSIHSFGGDDYPLSESYYFGNGKIVNWSPDGSQIGLLLVNSLMIIDAVRFTPLLTLNVSSDSEMFTWSPDGQKFALLVGQENSWSVQIWNIQTRQMDAELPFQGVQGNYPSMLEWSPDGAHIAALSRKQLQIIRMAETVSSYPLDEPNDHGILAWSPDGNYLAVAVSFHTDLETGEDNSEPHPFSIWDVVAKKKVHSFGNGTLDDLPYGLAWSKDGSHITTIGLTYEQENWYWL
ncbi:MAG TPA: WD40 repeat domain-containing protein [Ktedonobacteraceae bacterium]|nr:WD40 repeat domain-containing protein [Ktedonobacteraceae bacterium]